MAFAMPPPCSPTGAGDVGEEGEVERACALVDQVEEDRDQRNDDHDRRENGEAADEVVRCSAAGLVQAHGLWFESPSVVGWLLRGCVLMSVHPCRSAACDRPDHEAGDRVDDDGDEEEREADLDERAEVDVAGGFGELVWR